MTDSTEPPKYQLKRNEIVMVCDTPAAVACGELVSRYDMRASRESKWWGHPSFSSLPDGTMVFRLPSNVHNMSLLHQCGASPDMNDSETGRRMRFFCMSKREFTTSLPLKPFQMDGGMWLVKRDLRGILAYPVGLGKTITSIAALLSDEERYLPAIILAPAHVKLNWAEEWEKWGGDPKDVTVLFGRTPDEAEVTGRKLIVLNHHILGGWVETLQAVCPKTVVIDEAHNFVNSNTKTYPLVEKLARTCGRRVLLLTATPLVNDLSDLWGLTNLISPDILGLKGVFADTFMPEEKAKARMFASRWSGGFNKVGWAAVSKAKLPKALMERRIAELREVLHKSIMLRVKKADVVEQLPEITETHLRIDIPKTTPEGREFWRIEDECQAKMDEAKTDILASGEMLPAFGLARSNAAKAKIPDMTAWLQDFLAQSDETEKIVVVGWSVEPLTQLHNKFKKVSLLVNGQIDSKKKKEREHLFDNDPEKRILFGNVKSIGTGINLVAASTMVFLELPLTAVDFDQVKGRIDRISQKSKALSYYYMTIRKSIEEKKVWKMIHRKQKLSGDLGV